jgi:replication-associated recombination protein RarA
MNTPLSINLRPNSLDDIIGQSHLVGEDKVLTNLVKNKKLFSMILYGRPGIGKTSLANALVNELDLRYRSLNAVINNKQGPVLIKLSMDELIDTLNNMFVINDKDAVNMEFRA